MRKIQRILMPILGVLVAVGTSNASGPAKPNYSMDGFVFFTNVKNAVNKGALVPYIGFGESPLIGNHYQSGVILNTTGLTPVDDHTFTFDGVVGPNPYLAKHPKIHLITTTHGNIYCTWTAKFTVTIINANGDAILSGDGAFKVVGGTGRYREATGSFRTLFETAPVPHDANDADATVTEVGTIKKR